MTREEAIWRLENCLECTDCFTCGSHDEALGLAIAALREQEVASDVIMRPMTNADRIRAMSDEELADLVWTGSCPKTKEWATCQENRCYECWLEWLQQPYISEDIKRSEYIKKDIEGDA